MNHRHRTLFRLLALRFGRRAPITGAEVGVEFGRTSRMLLAYFPSLRLTMVDNWQVGDRRQRRETERAARRRTRNYSDRRFIIRGDSAQVGAALPDDWYDFVFLDADHRYESVKRDLEAWWRKVAPGGLLVGDDYHGRNEKRGLGWGVGRAADEWSQANQVPIWTMPLNLFVVEKR